MKSLIEKITTSDIGIALRNIIGFRPLYMSLNNKYKGSISVSDAFLWRTDNGFKTTFNYTDILGLFYKIKNSYVEVFFFSKKNVLIKKIVIKNLNYSNELLIDKEFLNGVENYGTFYIYHRYNGDFKDDLILSNRCYVGFSIDNSLSSFVHGNVLARYQSLNGKYEDTDIVKNSFFANNFYRIQNSFAEFTKSELFFTNPTSKIINFSIGTNKYSLKKGCSLLINLTEKEDLTIMSNCFYLRPLVFNYRNSFFDVYHG